MEKTGKGYCLTECQKWTGKQDLELETKSEL